MAPWVAATRVISRMTLSGKRWTRSETRGSSIRNLGCGRSVDAFGIVPLAPRYDAAEVEKHVGGALNGPPAVTRVDDSDDNHNPTDDSRSLGRPK
jgi:hypothetical protein